MVNPVPNYPVSTPYKKTGSMWKACGWHTGQDYAAPAGTRVVAARAGTTKHVNYGSSFGSHQIAVQCDDGTEDFYAHMTSRAANNIRVDAGAWVGYVGSEGNSTGNHLHFERHKVKNQWNCGNMDDPMKSHNAGGSTVAQDVYNYEYSGKSEDTKAIPLNEYVWVTKDTDDPAASGLEFKLIYLNVKLTWKGTGFANIRVKFIREGDDSTAYQDYLVHSSQSEFLLTHSHMEMGEKGIGGKWYMKVTSPDGSLASCAVGTRYNKYATIKDKG